MTNFLSYPKTKATFDLLKELGIEWEPESDKIIALKDSFFDGDTSVVWTDTTRAVDIPSHKTATVLPALNALHLLELIRVVFKNDKNAISDDLLLSKIAMVGPGPTKICDTAESILIAHFFLPKWWGGIPVLHNLEECWDEFLQEAGRLKK